MRKCQRCGSPAIANNARYCRPCADDVRREGKKRAAYKHGHSNTRLYSVTDSAWPAGHGLTSVEWRHLAKDDPELAGAILADRNGRLFQLTPAGPVVVVAQDAIIRSATFALPEQHTHDDAPGAINYTVQE